MGEVGMSKDWMICRWRWVSLKGAVGVGKLRIRPFDDPGVLRSLRDNIRRVRRPRAAEIVVESLLGRPARITEVAL